MLLAMPESWQVTPNRACSHRTFPSLEIGGCGLQDYNNHASTYIQNSQWCCHKTQVNREQACADISMYNVIVHGLVYISMIASMKLVTKILHKLECTSREEPCFIVYPVSFSTTAAHTHTNQLP